MSRLDDRKYFIVKHDYESLEYLPNLIWRAARRKRECPRGFDWIRKGDRWIAFAYTEVWGERGKSLSAITGFYECIEPANYQRIPPSPADRRGWRSKGGSYWHHLALIADVARAPGVWFVIGKRHAEQPANELAFHRLTIFLASARLSRQP